MLSTKLDKKENRSKKRTLKVYDFMTYMFIILPLGFKYTLMS